MHFIHINADLESGMAKCSYKTGTFIAAKTIISRGLFGFCFVFGVRKFNYK